MKGVSFKWGKDQQAAFEEIKDCIEKIPLLYYPLPGKEFQLKMDARVARNPQTRQGSTVRRPFRWTLLCTCTRKMKVTQSRWRETSSQIPSLRKRQTKRRKRRAKRGSSSAKTLQDRILSLTTIVASCDANPLCEIFAGLCRTHSLTTCSTHNSSWMVLHQRPYDTCLTT